MRYLVTGGGSGIGQAVATLAVKQAPDPSQVSVALVDRNQETLDAVAQALSQLGAHVLAIPADLADPESPGKAVAAAVSDFGGLDVVASIAGITAVAPLEELDLETYERTFAINTRATWLLGKAAYPALRESRGSIVAIASISATYPTPPLGAYSPSKAALLMIIKQMALEWGPVGIRANCVSPGPTDTALTLGAFGDATSATARANRAHREGIIPLRKIGKAEDVAQAVLFLAGPLAGQITGVDLVVDGGLTQTLMPMAGGVPGYLPPVTVPTGESA